MPKNVADIVSGMVKGSDDDLLTWRKALFCLALSPATALFVTEETFYLVLIAPLAMMLAFVFVEAWERQPRHGKFGRIGRLSPDELAKAQSRLRSRKA